MQHVGTLLRQLTFDLVFLIENVALLALALNSNITELRENKVTFSVVLLGFSVVGVILKCVYYRYLHIWAWLIMDYITTKEDGQWKCMIFSSMFLCGELKERKLLLCCLPKLVFCLVSMIFGERYFSMTGTSCSAFTAILSVILVPFALGVGLIVLCFLIALMVLFSPIFVFLVLPCIIFSKCREISENDKAVKEIKVAKADFIDGEKDENGVVMTELKEIISTQPVRPDNQDDDLDEVHKLNVINDIKSNGIA